MAGSVTPLQSCRLCVVIIVFGEVYKRRSPIGRFDEVASDLVARRDAMKSLSLAFEGRECSFSARPGDASSVVNFNGLCRPRRDLAQAARRS